MMNSSKVYCRKGVKKMVEAKTILIDHEDNLLVRVDAVTELGGKEYKLVSYEIWTDHEKFKENICEEWKENEQYIYCSNYATVDEEDMIQTFKKRFMN